MLRAQSRVGFAEATRRPPKTSPNRVGLDVPVTGETSGDHPPSESPSPSVVRRAGARAIRMRSKIATKRPIAAASDASDGFETARGRYGRFDGGPSASGAQTDGLFDAATSAENAVGLRTALRRRGSRFRGGESGL